MEEYINLKGVCFLKAHVLKYKTEETFLQACEKKGLLKEIIAEERTAILKEVYKIAKKQK